MKILLAWLVLIATTISGCVFSVPYDRPDDPNSPTIFVNPPERGGFLYFMNGEDCSRSTALPGEFLDGSKLIKPFPVPANKMLAIALIDRYLKSDKYDSYYVTCTAMTSFIPKPGQEYTVNYIEGENACTAVVFSRRKGSDDKLFLLQSASMREPVSGMAATSAHCRRIDE